MPLTVIDSPYREITRPIIDFVEVARRDSPARRGHRLHPGVRGRPLVGEPAAQPERAAAQGPAALRAGRDGDQRARGSCASTATRTWTGSTRRSTRGPARGPAGAVPPAAPRRPPSTAPAGSGPDGTGRDRATAAGIDVPGLDEGDRVELTVGRGRPRRALRGPGSDGQVVFVRHALPGERVHRRGHRGAPGLPAGRRGRGPRGRRRTGSSRPARTRGRAAAAAATSSTSPRPPSWPGRPRWCASS